MEIQKRNKTVHIILWIAQVLLALMFIMAGTMKAFQPIEALTESLPWVTTVPEGLVRFIGISELLGGIGLIIPSAFRFKPFLTTWAALGLAVVMVFAAIFHAVRGEFSAIGVNAVLMAIFLFIAWGRSKKAPIQAK
ncbi:DoxX family protein [Algibacter amylolyticus]|uniref:DoxX family protein n=1 Tax=Algibacter amylolyticus TaxID=1608400 RepID=A0A5M7B1N4_9FLAO|nr:DoxX family protein [Algibacter amylolyticus]KAA5823543.1 DoxX family protein [Algibacter amylolyticus]MBB5267697.1 putative membrane protein YphA (DoxX/SURF4 family) [Algibacter amylolyticus]TSJ74031.1 DoxX family protein [Algibacter amylolyticus]